MQTLQSFRAERGRMVADRHELDAYILSLPENIEYFSGYGTPEEIQNNPAVIEAYLGVSRKGVRQ